MTANVTDKNTKFSLLFAEFAFAIIVVIVGELWHTCLVIRREVRGLRPELDRNLDALAKRPVLAALAHELVATSKHKVKGLLEGRLVEHVVLPPDQLAGVFCTVMKALEPGDTYQTVTVPMFWSERHLGGTKRFYEENNAAAVRHVVIERVFIVPPRLRPEHRRALEEYHRHCPNRPGLTTKVHELSRQDFDELMNSTHGNYALVHPARGSRLVVGMRYVRNRRRRGHFFSHVVLQEAEPSFQKLHERFTDYFTPLERVSLADYLLGRQASPLPESSRLGVTE